MQSVSNDKKSSMIIAQLANPDGSTGSSQIDKILLNAVSQIWEEYDTDENGWLDHDEMRLFVQDILV